MAYKYFVEVKDTNGKEVFKCNDKFEDFNIFNESINFLVYFLNDQRYLVSIFNKVDYNKVAFYIEDGQYVGDENDIMRRLEKLFMGGDVNEKKTWTFENVD